VVRIRKERKESKNNRTKTHRTVNFCSFPKVDGISPLSPALSMYLFGRNREQNFNTRVSEMISNVLSNNGNIFRRTMI
jgi:hypothetical protein